MSREVAWIAYPWKRPTGAGYAYDLRVSFTTTGGAVWTKPVILNRDGKAAQHGFVSLAPSGEGVELPPWRAAFVRGYMNRAEVDRCLGEATKKVLPSQDGSGEGSGVVPELSSSAPTGG